MCTQGFLLVRGNTNRVHCRHNAQLLPKSFCRETKPHRFHQDTTTVLFVVLQHEVWLTSLMSEVQVYFLNTILNVCISRGNWSLRDVSNLHRLNKTRAQNLSGIPEQGQSDSCNLTRKTRHPHKWRLNCLIPAVCRAPRWSWLWRTSLTLPIHNPWSGPLWANMTSATTNCQLSAQSKKIKMMQCLTSNAHKEQLG